MNWDIVEGQWKQLRGRAKQVWSKLTDDDLANISGKREQHSGKLQERYGIKKDQAEEQINDWISRLDEEPRKEKRSRPS